MAETGMRGATAVGGIGTAGMGRALGFTSFELMALTSANALSDCGLTLADVDGLFVSSATNAMPTVSAAAYLGIHPRYARSTFIGGSGLVALAVDAALALRAGMCDVALIAYGSDQRSAGGKLQVLSELQPYEPEYGVA
jgi:hypothetical protein